MTARSLTRILYPVTGLLLIVVAWALACWLGRLPVVVLPSPDKVLFAFVGNMRLLLEESWVTLKETLYGFGLALLLGLPMAVAVATSRTLNLMFYPLLVALQSVPNARAMLESGFTTVRDVGTIRALVDVALRDAINRGDVIGPRMFVAGAYVTITGGAGAANGLAPDIVLPWDMHYGEANSPWEVRQVVRKLARDGVDHIKILSSGAVTTHNSNLKSQEFTLEELQAAVDEANHFGLRVESHAHSPEGIKNAIRAGVASVEHATMIDDEGIALAKQRGTYLDMDIGNDECVQESGKNGQIPKDVLEKEAQVALAQYDNFRKAVTAGVKMSFGTDAIICPFGTGGKQFAYMVRYGMTPMQAIQSATSNAADLLGHSNEFGSIKPGKYADIIAVTGDPLADIRLLEDVKFVMKDGRIYKQ